MSRPPSGKGGPDEGVHVCEVWIDLLRTRRRVTIGEGVKAAAAVGERLILDGWYHDSSGIGFALDTYCHYLQGRGRGDYSGPRVWEGPYIRPVLTVGALAPAGFSPTPNQKDLLRQCTRAPDDAALHKKAADAIKGLGRMEWAKYIRNLPAMRHVYRWWVQEDRDFLEGYWLSLDMIPWEFAPGFRRRHNKVPRIHVFGY